MDWKGLLRKPGTVVAGLAVCSGLLVDFQGAASKVSDAIPIIAAFLPLIAIGGVTFFGFWSITSVSAFLWSLPPAAKFGGYYPVIVSVRLSCVEHMNDRLRSTTPPQIYARAHEITESLYRFGILCPNVSPNDKDYVVTWFNFLTKLAPLARHEDLYNAQNFFGSQT